MGFLFVGFSRAKDKRLAGPYVGDGFPAGPRPYQMETVRSYESGLAVG